MAAISAKSSFVALSESVGATYVPLRTAPDAGVLAVYLKSWKRVWLHIGASPARVYHFSCTSLKINCSMVSWVFHSIIALPLSSTCIVVALHVLFFPVT